MEELRAQIKQLRRDLSILNDVVQGLIPLVLETCPGGYCDECPLGEYCDSGENEEYFIYNT